MTTTKVAGQTKDVGFIIGVRKTIPLPPEEVWDFLFSAKGLTLWLGKVNKPFTDAGQSYKTRDGIEGTMRVFTPYSHVRMGWKRPDWPNDTTLQVRVLNNKGKATISFHQEKLSGPEQRTEMKAYWERVLQNIITALLPG